MNEHEVWTGEPAPVRGAYWVRVDDGHVTIATFNAGEKLICIRERSSAPIPPAEEIAAMREVCAAVIELRREREKWDEMPGMSKAEEVIWNAQQSVVGRCEGRMQDALAKLDAARKGGAT